MAPKIKFRNYVPESSEGPPSKTSSEIPQATSLPLPPPSFFKPDLPLPPPQPPQQPIPAYTQSQRQPSSKFNSYLGPQPPKQPIPMMAGMQGLPTSFSGHVPHSSTPIGGGQPTGKGRGGKGKGGKANGNRQNDFGLHYGNNSGSVKRPYEASISRAGDSNAGYSHRGGRGGKSKGGGKGGAGNNAASDGSVLESSFHNAYLNSNLIVICKVIFTLLFRCALLLLRFWSGSFVEDPWALLLAHAQRAT